MTPEEQIRWVRSIRTLCLTGVLLAIAGVARLVLGHPHVVISLTLIAVIMLCAGAVAYFFHG